MRKLILLLLISNVAFADKITLRDGKSIEGDIAEANSTHIIFKRKSDFQLFRISIDQLAYGSQKNIELYYSNSRHSSINPVELPLKQKTLNTFANYIDQLIEGKLKQSRVSKTSKIDDYTFIRRIFLTLIGRTPTEKEISSFINNQDREKKDNLAIKLLSSEGHTSHQLNWISDILRVKDRVNGTNINVGSPYRSWLRRSISQNKKFDQLVKDLLSSSGKLFDSDEAAAISYFLRDRGMQADNLSHTIRIFLGTRLQCAMCHDHPFDKWTQKQFYEMTAFTSGIGSVRLNDQGKKVGKLGKIIQSDATPSAGLFNNWRNQVRDSLVFGIENNGTGVFKLPKDFAEDNGKPGELVYAKAIFTPEIKFDKSKKEENSRTLFAEWVTGKDNPRFTTVIANRMWKRVFGIGLIEPIDSMMDDTVSSNPELIKFLERMMISVDYDLREFQRVLVSTDLFSRKSIKEDYKDIKEFNFSGPPLRRMSGEQIWDSLVSLVYNNIDEKEREYQHNKYNYSLIYKKYKDISAEEIYKDFKEINKAYPKERNLMKALGFDQSSYKKIKDRSLVRSSYLSHPTPGGHLIRQFGGSDREQIENSNTEPNAPQVLNLLNGFVEKNILSNKNADFMKSMQSKNTAKEKVESAFISILGRKPSIKEYSLLKSMIEEQDGFKHVSWILLNSHEFIFIK